MFVWSLDGRRRIRAGFWLALPAVALGLFAVCALLGGLLDTFTGFLAPDWGGALSTLMVLFFLSPMLIAGIFGVRLLRRTTKYDVKGALITGLLVGIIQGSHYLKILLTSAFHVSDDQAFGWTDLILVSAAVAIYVLANMVVLWRDGIPHEGCREFYGRVAALLIALSILDVGVATANNHIHHESVQAHFLILGFLPFIVPWLYYKVSLRIVHGKRAPRRVPGTFKLHPPTSET